MMPMAAKLSDRRGYHSFVETRRIAVTAIGSMIGRLSRSPTGCSLTSQMMSPCASLMRRSTKPSKFKDGVPLNGYWSVASAPAERYVSHGPGRKPKRGRMSART